MTDRLAFSVAEAAEALGVSEYVIRDEVARGTIRVARFGRRIVIPRAALEERLSAGVEMDPYVGPVEVRA